MTLVTRRRTTVGVLTVGLALYSLGLVMHRPSGAAVARWRADSLDYRHQLEKWARDSLTIDSVARTINTDSTYRLWHRMLSMEHPETLFPQLDCERDRIMRHYGYRPAALAFKRMDDTLMRSVDRAAMTAMLERIPRGIVRTITSESDCGSMGPDAPDTLNGVPLQFEPARPSSPRKRW
jgi:hypothetical protein